MNKYLFDYEYMKIVNNILNNDTFNEIDSIIHHGTSRLTHSIRVSYYSYKIAKKLNLDYTSCARGGLLHDFFMSDNNRNKKEKLLSTFIHPKYAVINANEIITLNDKEKNIIRSHMFPINLSIPKYLESWIVSLVDKVIGLYEFFITYKNPLKYATQYLYIFTFLSYFN